MKLFFTFFSVALGFSFHNTIAVLEGHSGKRSEFVRTPKFNISSLSDSWKNNKYINTKINREYYKEIKEICKNSGIYISKPIKNNAFIAELIEKGKTIWESRSKKIIETQEIFKDIIRRF